MSADNRIRPIALFISALNGSGAQRVGVNLANALVDLTERPVHLILAAEKPLAQRLPKAVVKT